MRRTHARCRGPAGLAGTNAIPIHDVVAGNRQGRGSPEQITLFESQGLALEDLAVADIVYKRAKEQGAGITLPN